MNALALLRSNKSLRAQLSQTLQDNASLKETLAVLSDPAHQIALQEYREGGFDGEKMTIDEFINS